MAGMPVAGTRASPDGWQEDGGHQDENGVDIPMDLSIPDFLLDRNCTSAISQTARQTLIPEKISNHGE